MAIGWGDMPGRLSALGSVFALGFAAVAVVVTRRTYQIESERDYGVAFDADTAGLPQQQFVAGLQNPSTTDASSARMTGSEI
ncbi:hypothetical protein [Streptomyces sp. NBC_00989]|uniref:hypothetical protein n=1 Tax=Streptomyces sp. NBC_00989 TaxID=2903705 RepID=UPI0038678870|nr:hypothetical protein OG714_07795 [Streptomyces sp. NBC_00989]